MPRGLMKLLTYQTTTNGPLTECAVAISKQGISLLKLEAPVPTQQSGTTGIPLLGINLIPGSGPQQVGRKGQGKDAAECSCL